MGAGVVAQARSASYRVSWELHRAGEMMRQIVDKIGHAHEAEAVIAYHPAFPERSLPSGTSIERGLSL